MSDITISLDAVRGEVSKFDQIGAGLAALEAQHPKDVVYDVTSTAGMESAIVARRAWREPRIAVEKARKAAKAPVLELGRTIDRFAGQLEDKLRAGEDHYDAQIQVEEQRKEAARQEKLRAEAERIAAIRTRITTTFRVGPNPNGERFSVNHLTVIRQRIDSVGCEQFGDLKIEAEETKAHVLADLDRALTEQRLYEAQLADVAQQKAALAEERRQEAAAAAERRAAEETERKAQAERMAHQQAQIDAQRAEMDRREAEAREADRARLAAIAAEGARVAQERQAELDRQASIAAQKKQVEEAAQAAEHAAAGTMHDILSDWKELDEDPGVHDSDYEDRLDDLRARRDAILAQIRGTE